MKIPNRCLALGLLLLSGWANGQTPAAPPCKALGDLGCYYVPSHLAADARPDLLVYLRGYYHDSGVIPSGQRTASARQAFERYAMKPMADGRGLVVLVTGSSHLPVGASELDALRRETGLEFGRVSVASHSGGFDGLSKTLDTLPRVDRIVMLDNFYFGPDLSKKVQDRVVHGAACTGFLTAHNKGRHASAFKPYVACPIEPHDDYGHDDAVVRCLGTYLGQTSCP